MIIIKYTWDMTYDLIIHFQLLLLKPYSKIKFENSSQRLPYTTVKSLHDYSFKRFKIGTLKCNSIQITFEQNSLNPDELFYTSWLSSFR